MQVLRCAASITVDAKALGLRMMHSITKTPQQYSRMHSSSRGTFGCLRPQRSGLGGIGIAAASRSVVAFSGSGAAAAAAAAAAARRAWGPAARPLLLGAPHNAAATPSFAARGAVVAAFHSLKDEEQQQQQGHHILEQRQRQRRHQAFLVPRAAAAATAAAWADFSTSGPHVNGNSTSNAAGADHAPATSSAAAAAAAAAAADSSSSSSSSSGFLDTAAAADRAASDAAEELHAVDTAIRANAAIFVAKLAVFFISSSSAMLAEAIHSLVDVANQMLLRVGIRKAEKGPTRQHPYGYARDQFVWPLISAVGIFCCGAGVSFIHGVQSLFAPHEIGPLFWNFVVLGVSLLLEGHSLRVAVDTLRRRAERQGMGLWAYIRAGSDPAATAIMMEDGAAVAGLVIAGTCLGLVQATGMAVWDAAGSLAVAGLLGAVAVTLIQRNREWLIGKSMPPESEALIVEYLRRQAVVRSIDSVRTEEIGLRVYRCVFLGGWGGVVVV
jgi:zinc transporter 9